MAVHMMHNDSVKTFEDISHHLELGEECLEATKQVDQAYATEPSSHGVGRKKCKRGYFGRGKYGEAQKDTKSNQHKRGGQRGKMKSKVKCFVCGKVGHFVRGCTEQKVPSWTSKSNDVYVSSRN